MARGSVTKRNGSWGFRVDAGFDPESGTRRQIRRQGFRTKRAAEAALAEFQKTVIDGTVVSASGLRLDDFLDEWLQGQESHLRPTSHYSYVVAAKRLKKHLGRYKLQALTPLQIEKFYADLARPRRAQRRGACAEDGEEHSRRASQGARRRRAPWTRRPERRCGSSNADGNAAGDDDVEFRPTQDVQRSCGGFEDAPCVHAARLDGDAAR